MGFTTGSTTLYAGWVPLAVFTAMLLHPVPSSAMEGSSVQLSRQGNSSFQQSLRVVAMLHGSAMGWRLLHSSPVYMSLAAQYLHKSLLSTGGVEYAAYRSLLGLLRYVIAFLANLVLPQRTKLSASTIASGASPSQAAFGTGRRAAILFLISMYLKYMFIGLEMAYVVPLTLDA